MMSKIRFIDPIIVIGIVISIALAVILVLIGQDQATSLLIGLVVTIITLLVDIIARLRESEARIIQISEFGNSLASDSWLFDILRQIVNDYRVVKTRNYDTYIRRMSAALVECRDVVHSLSEGYLITDVLGQFSLGRRGINNAEKEIIAVQYANPSFWRTLFGEKYLESNEEAIKRGVKIVRIWIQSKEILTEYRDIINAQESKGIQVFIAETHIVPHALLEDFAVMDSQLYIRLELTLDGHSKHERISIDPIEIERAKNNFDVLLRYVRTPSEYFGQS